MKIIEDKARQLANNFSLNSQISSSGFSSTIRQEFMDTVWGYPEDFILGNNEPDVKKLKEAYRDLARSYGVKI